MVKKSIAIKTILTILFGILIFVSLFVASNAASYKIEDNTLYIYTADAIVTKPWGDQYFNQVVFGNNLTFVPDDALKYNENIEKIVLGDNIEYIGASAFYCDRNLKEIVFNKKCEYTCTSSFAGCENLDNIVFPEGFTTIGESCFYRCYALSNIQFPSTLTTISKWAFYYCDGLKNVDIPNSVTSVGNCAFYRCHNLESISFPSTIKAVPGAVCYQNYNLKHVTISEGITSIGENAFEDCYSLEFVNLPNSLKNIEYYAFKGCKPSYYYFGNNIEYINEEAFDYENDVKIFSKSSYVSTYSQDYENINVFDVPSFTDLNPNRWYYNTILNASMFFNLKGTGNGQFNPNGNLTRATACLLLYPETEEYEVTDYDDVTKGSWYYDAVMIATTKCTTYGIGNGLFAPKAQMTREQYITMLYRIYGATIVSTNVIDTESYTDIQQVHSWAIDAIKWALNNNIIHGTSATTLSPTKSITRAEAISILYNIKTR